MAFSHLAHKKKSNLVLVVMFLVTGGFSLIGQKHVPVMPWNNIDNEAIGSYTYKEFNDKTGAFEIIGLIKTSKFNHATVIKSDVSNECKFLIIGDSHAGHLRHGFSRQVAQRTGCDVHIQTSTGCPPLFGFYKVYNFKQKAEPPRQMACREQVRLWEKFVVTEGKEYRAIIFSSRWNWLVNENKYGERGIREDALLPYEVNAEVARNITDGQRKENFQRAIQNTIKIVRKAASEALFLSQPPVKMLGPHMPPS